MIPPGWQHKKLGQVCEFQRGFDLPTKDRKPGNIPIISSSGISGYHDEAKVLPPGLVTGRYGTIGQIFYIDKPFWPLNTALWVKNFHNNFPLFIYYLLSLFDFKKFSDKTGVPGINRNDLHKVKVLLPPNHEQKRIAQILSTWDQAIAVTEKLITNSEAQKKALMQQLLTGKRRFKKFITSTKIRTDHFTAIPVDWDRKQIGKVAIEVTCRNTNQEKYPVLSCTKHQGFVTSLTYFNKQVFSKDTRNYKIIKRGQFGFPSNHIEEGSIGYQDIVDCGIVSPIYCVFKTTSSINDGYLYKLLKTDLYRQIFAASTNASVDRRGSLRWKEFSKIYIPAPNEREQAEISAAIDSISEVSKALVSKLNYLQQEKSALMQQLLTGKRRVKINSDAVEATAKAG